MKLKYHLQQWSSTWQLSHLVVGSPPSPPPPDRKISSYMCNLNVTWHMLLEYWYETYDMTYGNPSSIAKKALVKDNALGGVWFPWKLTHNENIYNCKNGETLHPLDSPLKLQLLPVSMVSLSIVAPCCVGNSPQHMPVQPPTNAVDIPTWNSFPESAW